MSNQIACDIQILVLIENNFSLGFEGSFALIENAGNDLHGFLLHSTIILPGIIFMEKEKYCTFLF